MRAAKRGDPIEKVRQPLGPPKDGSRGFAAGRGRPIKLPGLTALAPGVQAPIPLTTSDAPQTTAPGSGTSAAEADGPARVATPSAAVSVFKATSTGPGNMGEAPASGVESTNESSSMMANGAHAHESRPDSQASEVTRGQTQHASGADGTRQPDGLRQTNLQEIADGAAQQSSDSQDAATSLLQGLLQKGRTSAATQAAGTRGQDMQLADPTSFLSHGMGSHAEDQSSAAPAALAGSAAAAASSSSSIDMLAQLLAGHQLQAPKRSHNPPPGFPAIDPAMSPQQFRATPPHEANAQNSVHQHPTHQSASAQDPTHQHATMREMQSPSPSHPVHGQMHLPPGLSPPHAGGSHPGSHAGGSQPGSHPASHAASPRDVPLMQQGRAASSGDGPTALKPPQDGQHAPASGPNLLSLLQQHGQAAGLGQLPQQPPQQPLGLDGPAGLQQLQLHIALLVQRAVPGLPYKIEPWQVHTYFRSIYTHCQGKELYA